MKKTYTWIWIILLAMALALPFTGRTAHASGTAASGEQQETIPAEGVSYTITYPDGTVITENAAGEPLSYEDVLELLEEKNWKLLGSFTTDEKGEAVFPAEWAQGWVKIIESKAPEGYVFGEEREKTVNLQDGMVVFVNPKDKSGESQPNESQSPTEVPTEAPMDPPTQAPTEGPRGGSGPDTGDHSNLTLWILLALGAFGVLSTLFLLAEKKEKR